MEGLFPPNRDENIAETLRALWKDYKHWEITPKTDTLE